MSREGLAPTHVDDVCFSMARSASGKSSCRRRGKVLVLVVILLPTIIALLGLVLDVGWLLKDRRMAQHAADAAATASAMELMLREPTSSAIAVAEEYAKERNGLTKAVVQVNIPPTSGPFAGQSGFVETLVSRQSELWFFQGRRQTAARAVAGFRASTAGAAIVVLDPDPAPLSIVLPGGLPAILAPPELFAPNLAGLEILGLGTVRVDGAVFVNTTWGGVDQDGDPAGSGPGPPYGITCMPPAPVTSLHARDIRVVGGVDAPANYQHFETGEPSPLDANRFPVRDPFAALPVPTVHSDPANVRPTMQGSASVTPLTLLSGPVVLEPGVYEWIEVTAGQAVFQPGVYIVRDVNPATGIAVAIVAGEVVADGVMFYVTDSSGYHPGSGMPDSEDSPTPPALGSTSMLPSVVINATLLQGTLRALSDSGSPFDGMLFYQRRRDRRPIVLLNPQLLGPGALSGTIYAKWGHLSLLSSGTLDLRAAVGTMRNVSVGQTAFLPTRLLPPAEDVFLVE